MSDSMQRAERVQSASGKSLPCGVIPRDVLRCALLAVSLLACGHSPTAPEPVVQISLRAAPMVFHPTLPLVGQESGTRCDVWDLSTTLYRGTIAVHECRGWASPQPPLAPALAAATPAEEIDELTRAEHPDAGAMLWAASHDGRWVATARRGGRTARVWDAKTHAEVRVLPVRGSDAAARVENLMWTRSGAVVVATTGDGPQLWSPLDPEREFQQPLRRRSDGYERYFVDPAGRYLGFTTRAHRKPLDVSVVGVISFSEEHMSDALLAERPWTDRRFEMVTWAGLRPTLFALRSRLSGELELCGRTERAVIAVDPTRGIRTLDLEPTRALTLLAPSPDGRHALVGTNDAPPLEPCGDAPAAASKDASPVLTLWDVETNKRTVVPDAGVEGVAWTGSGDRFAVTTSSDVRVLLRDDPANQVSWSGRGPLAFSTDGRALAYVGPDGVALRGLEGRGERVLGVTAATAIAFGPRRSVALATDSEISIWDIPSSSRRAGAPVRGVRRIAWSEAGDALLLWTRLGRAYLYRFDWPLPIEVPGTSAEQLLGWSGGGIILARGRDQVRRLWWEGRFRELRALPLDPEFYPDLTARWAFAGPDPELYGREYRLRRLHDGETIHVSDHRDRHIFASSGVFTPLPPERLAFRLGPEVLSSPMVRAAEATFALPVADLGERFIRGEKLLPGTR